jgi:hypothetical protein
MPFLKIFELSAHLATEFSISPARWTAIWPVAIVPIERWGKMDRNECYTVCGNFRTLILQCKTMQMMQDYANDAYSLSLHFYFQLTSLLFLSVLLTIGIYRLKVTFF